MRHETTDGSITAPCSCGERHELSFFLAQEGHRVSDDELDPERLARAMESTGIVKHDNEGMHAEYRTMAASIAAAYRALLETD